ncbi:CBS domain-containing protein [Halopenitus persicus]|uniref:CBS domain-containing protein n=1 Tax=Halopenitus persicus TaxID=1048396 RepID=A0A1H3KMV5_9EURY|nr:CBS domain-containing protein [Halopenitus persicus]QHS17856.1 CBS domain-containing protein [haloarchaeon 3A1-DGR]SDY53058.1 CBS domain-containing protein [Halopenitus persicus]
MPVKHLAVEPVVAEPDTPATRIAERLRDEGVGSVIVEEMGRPVGVVTDRDLAMAIADQRDVSGLEARDVMTEDPVTIEGDAEAVELPKKMAETHVRRVPVVDDGKLTGVATLDDVVATAGEELEDVAEVIEAQSPEYSP